ncbi:MAG: hypothetical protein CM1200mP9_09210 [Gammaproteobacteria bacterium]|nr:MAG: hypothetical protein CM1200mP9_09210 [Gammaproteobacteria bacterium]
MVDTYPETRFEDEHWLWPELTPTLMAEGDAVIALTPCRTPQRQILVMIHG